MIVHRKVWSNQVQNACTTLWNDVKLTRGLAGFDTIDV